MVGQCGLHKDKCSSDLGASVGTKCVVGVKENFSRPEGDGRDE